MFKKSVYFTVIWGLFCLVGTAGAADGEQSMFDDVSLTFVPTAITIPVPNGDFELLYKSGTAITGNISAGGWTFGVGPDCPIENGVYEFSDGTTGPNADIPGWVGYDRDGWIAEGGTYDRDQTTGNLQGSVNTQGNHTPGGSHSFLCNGGSWGNPAGGLITSAASLGSVTNGTYTLSMMAKGNATPIVLHLLADGVPLKPTSSVDPALTGDWQEISRTYDAASLEGYVGASLTIVLGVERNAGTSGLNPFLPILPNPADGAMDVKSTNRLLRWSPGRDHTAGYWDVYLGTDPEDLQLVADDKPFASKLYVHTAGFEPGQIYYWRVDPVDTDKTTIGIGDLWSFFVQPETASDPNPADWAKNKLTDVELSWRAGANGDFHHMYFGTDKDAVTNADKSSPEYRGRTVGTTTTFDPGELQRGTTYYWRVDEAKATGAEWKGAIWTFSTLPVLPILDLDLLGWWKLDEGSGNTAIDWSGHENHGEILNLGGGLGNDGNVWVDDPDKGMVLTFSGNDQTGAVVKAGKIPAIGATDSFTWAFWARQEGDGTGEFETILGNRDVGVDYPRFIMFTPTKFEYFVNTGEYTVDHGAVKGLDYPDLQDGVWTHHAITKDGTTLTYYRNGIETRKATTLVEQGENALYIGGDLVSGRWSGSIYNVRIYKRALSVAELESAMRRDAAVAWDPTPTHRRVVDIEGISRLSWKSGDNAIEHDVYLGTNAQLVAHATPEDTTGLYRSRQSGTDYTPDDLQMGQTYYWRIDEIKNDGSVSEGYVWYFTVAAYLIVDDFESYNDIDPPDPESHTIFGSSWLDGYLTPTTNGALVGYDPAQPPSDPSYMEQTIVYDGSQSLPFSYDNSSARYSEATLPLNDLTNWTLHNVTTLGIAVHGRVSSDDPAIGNDPEKIYVVVEDTTGKTGIANHPDNPDATTFAEWTEWLIDLAEIAAQGVDLSRVKTLTIRIGDKSAPGTGLIYIDGIRLYPDILVGLN